MSEPAQLRVADAAGDDFVEGLLVNRGEEAGHVELECPRRPLSVGADAPQELYQPVVGCQHALAVAAGERVVNERRLEHRLQARYQHVMHDAVAEIRGEYLARLRPVGDKANRAAGPVRVVPQLLLQRQQTGLSVHLEAKLVEGVALVTAADAVLPPQILEGEEVRVRSSESAGGEPVRPPRHAEAGPSS